MKTLKALRREMDQVTKEMVLLLAKRIKIAKRIARVKRKEKLPICDLHREQELKKKILNVAKTRQLDSKLVLKILEVILEGTKEEMGKIL